MKLSTKRSTAKSPDADFKPHYVGFMLLLSLALEQQNVSVSKSTSKAPPPPLPPFPLGSSHELSWVYEARAIFVDQYRHSMGHHGGSYLPENVFVLILGKVGLICPRFVPGLFLVYFWYMPSVSVAGLFIVCRRFAPILSNFCPWFVTGLSLV